MGGALRMQLRDYRRLAVVLAVLGLLTDQISKYAIFRGLADESLKISDNPLVYRLTLLTDTFHLLAQFEAVPTDEMSWLVRCNGPYLPSVNHGALFGLGGPLQHRANAGFAVVSLLAAGAVAYWLSRLSTARDRWLCVTLGLILGGTLGNLYDRLVFGGVRDFLHFHIPNVIDWPVFNLADCWLVCGAILLLIQAIFAPPPSPPKATDAPAATSQSQPTASTLA